MFEKDRPGVTPIPPIDPIDQLTMEIEVEVKRSEEIKIGLVVDCAKLNVREEPDPDADILCEVPSQTELVIDENNSTDEYYSVCTAAGVDGFCMKKFVSIQE